MIVVGPHLSVIARLDVRDMLELVDHHARAHGVSREDVCGRGRTKDVAAARHAVWAELRETTAMSYPEIAALFGGYNHTTIMSGVRKCGAIAAKRAVG